jgi:hypothetical protein
MRKLVGVAAFDSDKEVNPFFLSGRTALFELREG